MPKNPLYLKEPDTSEEEETKPNKKQTNKKPKPKQTNKKQQKKQMQANKKPQTFKTALTMVNTLASMNWFSFLKK